MFLISTSAIGNSAAGSTKAYAHFNARPQTKRKLRRLLRQSRDRCVNASDAWIPGIGRN
jgi:hypothetical protein